MGIKTRSSAREKRIAQHVEGFVRTYAAHDETSADSWFKLGCMLANVYEEQRRAGEEVVSRIGRRYDEFTPMCCWQQAVDLMPEHAQAWLRQGLHYWGEGEQEDEAERCLRSAVEHDPSSTTALMHLGMAVLPPAIEFTPQGKRIPAGEPDLERVAEAEAYFAKAIKLNENDAADWDVFNLLAEAAHRRRNKQLALSWYERGAERGDKFCQKMGKELARELAPVK